MATTKKKSTTTPTKKPAKAGPDGQAKSAAAKVPLKRPAVPKGAASKERAMSLNGPLTLEQAREIVGVSAEPSVAPVQVAVTRAAPAPLARRAPRSSGAAVPTTGVTPVTVAAERRKLAIQEREERNQRIRDYKATLALLQTHGVKGLPETAPATGSRRRSPGAATATSRGPLRIFAEGDSWFDYPVPLFGGGLIPRLESRLGVPILNLAKAGDETRFMLGVDQRQVIARQLHDGCPDGRPWELMLFSGGGNDIVAQPLALWVRDFNPAAAQPRDQLNSPRYASALALVRAAYEDLIELRDSLSPRTLLAFPAYDFAIPDGRGFCHLGPWLKPAFDLHRFPGDLVASTAVVREMLLEFAGMLKELEAKNKGVKFIDAQGTLSPVAASWHNEMHPSKSGFNLIADKFRTAIGQMFPGRVL